VVAHQLARMELQPLAKWLLHSFYATHKKPFANKAEPLQRLVVLKIKELRKFPHELHSDIALLVENDFLFFARIDAKKDHLVHVERAADWRRLE
jgi:hypothetical protein